MDARVVSATSVQRGRAGGLPWRIAADACTLTVFGLGLVAIAARERPSTVLLLLILAGLVDGVDGVLARRSGAASLHGAVLDVLADVTTFGVAPLVFVAGHTGLAGPALWAGGSLYMAATIFRLVRTARYYNQQHTGFMGLPMPATGILLAGFGLMLPGAAVLPLLIALSGLAVCRRDYPTLAGLWTSDRSRVAWFALGMVVLGLINFPAALVAALIGYAAYPW